MKVIKKKQMKPIMIYKDKAGNKIYKKYIKTRDVDQYYAKNKEGKIVCCGSFNTLAKRAKLKMSQVRPKGKSNIVSAYLYKKPVRRKK